MVIKQYDQMRNLFGLFILLGLLASCKDKTLPEPRYTVHFFITTTNGMNPSTAYVRVFDENGSNPDTLYKIEDDFRKTPVDFIVTLAPGKKGQFITEGTTREGIWTRHIEYDAVKLAQDTKGTSTMPFQLPE